MQCYTELLPPTAVTHAVTLPFTGPRDNNLVVAKTSLLQVFKLRPIAGNANDIREDEKAIENKLSLIGEYQLSGTVTALRRVKTLGTKSGGEALLIATKNAKLSLVEWDQENYRISTISIHYYEGESVVTQPFGPDLRDTESILTVDPSSRCAALKFGQRHLAILPFRQLGDELADMEVDNDIDERRRSQQQIANGEMPPTPYKASFVSTLTQIAPDLTHTVDLAFLYEYREPTLGIISSASQASAALIEMRKDILTYTVGTLDLEQRASTVLISVQNLPSDLWKVVPLALPIGGALLVGTNELVHVDQSGKTNAIAVNEFAKLGSNFGMADQSQLNLKLEDCVIEPLNNASGDMLMVLRDGSLAIVRFIMQGRSVGAMQVVQVADESGGLSFGGAPSCIASFHTNDFFVGSDVGDSVLLRSNNPPTALSRKRSHAQMRSEEQETNGEDEEDDDVEEDDLYGGAASTAQRTLSSSAPAVTQPVSAYHFREVNRLPTLGPINNVCFGRSPRSGNQRLEALASVGKGSGSQLAFLETGLSPELKRKTVISGAQDIWSIAAGRKEDSPSEMYDNLLFVYDGASTKAYSRTDLEPGNETSESNYIERTDTEFEQEGETVAIGTLANRTRIVQCRQTEIRTYDADLALSQIIPMVDEETDAELKIVHISFCDPYLLVLRDDSSVQVLQVEKNGDVEPLESEDISQHKWLSGCLYNGVLSGGDTMLFLLRDDGGLNMFSLPDFQPIYSIPTLHHVAPVLTSDATQRRVGAKETLTEILVADIGPTDDTNCYMILRSAADTLTIYQSFRYGEDGESWRWRKVPNTYLPKYEDLLGDDSSSASKLRSMHIAGLSTVAVLGASPSFIMKHATSMPKVLPVRLSHCRALTPMHAKTCDRGFAVLDNEDNVQECKFPEDAWFGTGWAVHRQALGDPPEEVRHVAYHEERGMYVVATCRPVDFKFVDEDGRHPDQDEITLRPQVPQYTVHLFSATSHRIINSFAMPYTEAITCMKVMPLEVSETTHAQKLLVVLGSAQQRGEDMPAKGAVTVLELLDVVPEPNDPETGVKLSLLSREEPRGAVTAVESLANGLVGTTQGQKIMVRGLKEDGSCLPVAFLDAQCQTATFKSLAQSGLWLTGDVWKGLWLGAFTEEPFKLTVLGKSRTQMEVVCAEFLPVDGDLYILIVDADMDLHVLQYDPENPKSLSGTRLLHRSTFHLGHFPTSMSLVPSMLAPFAAQNSADEAAPSSPLYHIIVTSQTGSLGLITPVDETTYRRLGAVEAHLTSVLEHAAGLNPREYRAVESEGFGARGVVDGALVQRIGELGSARRAEVLGRAGGDAWVLASDLEILGGGGLGWL